MSVVCSPFLGGFNGKFNQCFDGCQVLCSVLGSNSAEIFPVFYWSEKMSSQLKNNVYTALTSTLEFHS